MRGAVNPCQLLSMVHYPLSYRGQARVRACEYRAIRFGSSIHRIIATMVDREDGCVRFVMFACYREEPAELKMILTCCDGGTYLG